MMGKNEVLANELESEELVVGSANDLDLSRFTLCRGFGTSDIE